MHLNQIAAGSNVPHDINVIIEIPANSPPVKYEFDKAAGALVVDRFLPVAMHYPCNYGFMPHSLSEDGDPIDVLVVTPTPLVHGALVAARPVGVLQMADEKGTDEKILAVPSASVSPDYDHILKASDLPRLLLDKIAHFFERYKDLDPGKWVKIEGWASAEKAREAILASIARADGR